MPAYSPLIKMKSRYGTKRIIVSSAGTKKDDESNILSDFFDFEIDTSFDRAITRTFKEYRLREYVYESFDNSCSDYVFHLIVIFFLKEAMAQEDQILSLLKVFLAASSPIEVTHDFHWVKELMKVKTTSGLCEFQKWWNAEKAVLKKRDDDDVNVSYYPTQGLISYIKSHFSDVCTCLLEYGNGPVDLDCDKVDVLHARDVITEWQECTSPSDLEDRDTVSDFLKTGVSSTFPSTEIAMQFGNNHRVRYGEHERLPDECVSVKGVAVTKEAVKAFLEEPLIDTVSNVYEGVFDYHNNFYAPLAFGKYDLEFRCDQPSMSHVLRIFGTAFFKECGSKEIHILSPIASLTFVYKMKPTVLVSSKSNKRLIKWIENHIGGVNVLMYPLEFPKDLDALYNVMLSHSQFNMSLISNLCRLVTLVSDRTVKGDISKVLTTEELEPYMECITQWTTLKLSSFVMSDGNGKLIYPCGTQCAKHACVIGAFVAAQISGHVHEKHEFRCTCYMVYPSVAHATLCRIMLHDRVKAVGTTKLVNSNIRVTKQSATRNVVNASPKKPVSKGAMLRSRPPRAVVVMTEEEYQAKYDTSNVNKE